MLSPRLRSLETTETNGEDDYKGHAKVAAALVLLSQKATVLR